MFKVGDRVTIPGVHGAGVIKGLDKNNYAHLNWDDGGYGYAPISTLQLICFKPGDKVIINAPVTSFFSNQPGVVHSLLDNGALVTVLDGTYAFLFSELTLAPLEVHNPKCECACTFYYGKDWPDEKHFDYCPVHPKNRKAA